jgi:hypothetical protein
LLIIGWWKYSAGVMSAQESVPSARRVGASGREPRRRHAARLDRRQFGRKPLGLQMQVVFRLHVPEPPSLNDRIIRERTKKQYVRQAS